MPKAILLKFPGTNADAETERALQTVGFTTELIPFAVLERGHFDDADLAVFPGGFSYGDYVMAGRLAQLELTRKLGDTLQAFVARGGHVLGICNGFQILTKVGLLPAGSLVDNTSHRFQCRWVGLKNHRPDNPFLHGLPTEFELPIAHAEGRFVIDPATAQGYLDDGLVPLTYTSDVNGSTHGIAALQDATGRVFGLMPHPERFLRREHHYDQDWAPVEEGASAELGDTWGWGYTFFKSIHDHLALAPAT